jgi:phosphomevalonate kinase
MACAKEENMSEIIDINQYGGFSLGLYMAEVRLAGGTDEIFVVACDIEDAIEQIHKAFDDLNVLYISSVERIAGSFFVSDAAAKTLKAS